MTRRSFFALFALPFLAPREYTITDYVRHRSAWDQEYEYYLLRHRELVLSREIVFELRVWGDGSIIAAT